MLDPVTARASRSETNTDAAAVLALVVTERNKFGLDSNCGKQQLVHRLRCILM